jgi:hypothetical protein
MSLPMEVLTSAGKIRGRVDGKPVSIRSTTMPVIDPDAYYLKKITME